VDVAVTVGVRVGVSVKVKVFVCVDVAVIAGLYPRVAVGDKIAVTGGLVWLAVTVGTGKVISNAVPTITRFTTVAARRITPVIRRGVI
jgi:hypothetical protein